MKIVGAIIGSGIQDYYKTFDEFGADCHKMKLTFKLGEHTYEPLPRQYHGAWHGTAIIVDTGEGVKIGTR